MEFYRLPGDCQIAVCRQAKGEIMRVIKVLAAASVLVFTGCDTSATSDQTDPDVTNPNNPVVSRKLDLDLNDVSILFPAPETPGDVQTNILTLTDFDADRVLPEPMFREVMALITGPSTITIRQGEDLVEVPVDAGAIPGTSRRIRFPGENRRADWALAGLRIDPGAPGLTKDVFDVFGKSPQIRLTLQPINEQNGRVSITDGSLHLVYAFHDTKDLTAACNLHNRADMDGFSDAVADVVKIKQMLKADHGIETDGRDLGVHPAFDDEDSAAALRASLREFLNDHLTTDRLFAVSAAGIPLPAPEPWVFVAMQQNPLSGRIEAVPSPAIIQPGPAANFAQMISFIDTPKIQPKPATSNNLPIGCSFNQPGQVPVQIAGAGVSTATVFDEGDRAITDIAAVISDPTKSHFFNTDCVSCHTETRKEIDMARSTAGLIGASSRIDPDVIPDGQWNVRAFGWFPGFPPRAAGAHETVTRRAATETLEVVHCFETENWHRADRSCLP